MIKIGSKKHVIWQEYTLKIKELLAAGNRMEAAILIDVRDTLTEKRPAYMKGWTAEQITAHFRKYHESVADGTHPYVAEIIYG